MNRRVTIAWIVVFVIVAMAVGFVAGRSYAQNPSVIAIPKAWGSVKAAGGGSILLEDESGTIRLVSMSTGRIEALIARR